MSHVRARASSVGDTIAERRVLGCCYVPCVGDFSRRVVVVTHSTRSRATAHRFDEDEEFVNVLGIAFMDFCFIFRF